MTDYITKGEIISHLQPGERACWIRGYANIYAITDAGRVWGQRRKRWRKLNLSGRAGNQYLSINLLVDKIRKDVCIHRLVAEHFVPGWALGLEVLHGSGGALDNSAANLRWGTHSENMLQRRTDGTLRKGPARDEAIAQEILLRYHRPAGERPTQAKLAMEFGRSVPTINRIVSGRSYVRISKTVLGGAA